MPTVFKVSGFRFYFYSNEHLPQHIHVENGSCYARVVLETLEITDSYNLKPKEAKQIIKIIKKYKEQIQGAWNEHFKQ